MKKILFTIFLFASFGIYAQNVSREELFNEIDPLLTQLKTLQEKNKNLNAEVLALQTKLSELEEKTGGLENQTQANSKAINQTADELGLKITSAREITSQKFSAVDSSLGKTTLWAIFGILLAIFASSIVYWLLRKKQQSDKADVMKQLSETEFSIKAELTKQLNETKSSIETDTAEQLRKSKSSIEKDVAAQLSKAKTTIETDVAEQLNKTKSAIEEKLKKESGKKKKLIEKQKEDSTIA